MFAINVVHFYVLWLVMTNAFKWSPLTQFRECRAHDSGKSVEQQRDREPCGCLPFLVHRARGLECAFFRWRGPDSMRSSCVGQVPRQLLGRLEKHLVFMDSRALCDLWIYAPAPPYAMGCFGQLYLYLRALGVCVCVCVCVLGVTCLFVYQRSFTGDATYSEYVVNEWMNVVNCAHSQIIALWACLRIHKF